MGVVMKRLVVGTVLFLLVCTTLTLPSARADEGQSCGFDSPYWTVECTISSVRVPHGQGFTVDVTVTAKLTIYDFSLTVKSGPTSIVPDNVWSFDQGSKMDNGVTRHHTFQGNIPSAAATGDQYTLYMVVQGYNDTAKVNWGFNIGSWRITIWYWRQQGWFSTESPEYTQDTSTIGKTIEITAT